MTRLQTSKRCRLFEKIADDTWSHVIRNHRTGIQVNEPGRTNDIIAEIRDNYLSYPNIGVWAANGWREIDHGSDMDIFVEATTGRFIWWALQAKVLRLSGYYEGLKDLHGGEYQWSKLNRLSALSGCVVRYLFYNGVSNYVFSDYDRCHRQFSESQFGCSLVNTADVERISLLRTPKFNDFHPKHAEPWRVIVCCVLSIKSESATFYSMEQIKNAVSIYPESDGNTEIVSENSYEGQVNNFEPDAINTFSKSIDRNPAYRMVIRTTKSIYNL